MRVAEDAVRSWKHLHGRGEDLAPPVFFGMSTETPPRTWRRLALASGCGRYLGNTSTDVEKTSAKPKESSIRWKHLHGRGEDMVSSLCTDKSLETPPRTWRRLWLLHFRTRCQWKHLHGRGEDDVIGNTGNALTETPPRTWRRPCKASTQGMISGNTSTDVEKTEVWVEKAKRSKKHLHGRGEDSPEFNFWTRVEETPPRTWRRRS